MISPGFSTRGKKRGSLAILDRIRDILRTDIGKSLKLEIASRIVFSSPIVRMTQFLHEGPRHRHRICVSHRVISDKCTTTVRSRRTGDAEESRPVGGGVGDREERVSLFLFSLSLRQEKERRASAVFGRSQFVNCESRNQGRGRRRTRGMRVRGLGRAYDLSNRTSACQSLAGMV